ncbi:PIR Superfamily Protein [Plasmodium ovale wallikeri]|uniref:PIR Superfamily Protein n=1 Tax=Plasmodium ovale wallikeri TaxID=864142 RepID=A0A1A9AKZ5_PLAOA|nr:PIR Superfamily Protein [Plasmodium ovale wallikeri]
MAGDSGITTLTHYIPIYVFTGTITNDIKNLISKHGHINCGLRHEELCKKLNKLIYDTKTPILSLMDKDGQQKWNSEWRIEKNKFLNKLFQDEGFIYMCYSNKYTNNPRINQLLSKHIDFCKKKDVRRAEVVDNPAFSKCIQYNSWIESQRKTFTNEYLDNVSNFTSQTVDKYFSTKEHPQGRDPRLTYRHTSSAIGATAGISLFLIYLYKFTNIGSFFGHVNQKNNTMFLNMDTEPHNLTQPTSEFENSNFESSHYDISYYLLNNS